MWGGLLGWCMRTHKYSRTPYEGGNCFKDFLSLRRFQSVDLHENETWRARVHSFIYGPEWRQAQQRQDAPLQHQMGPRQNSSTPLLRADTIRGTLLNVRVQDRNTCFTK